MKCQVCGMPYDGEYVEYNAERKVGVYKCEKCNGLNQVKPKATKKTLVIDDVDV